MKDPKETGTAANEQTRREFLIHSGKCGIYTTPIILALLLPESAHAGAPPPGSGGGPDV